MEFEDEEIDGLGRPRRGRQSASSSSPAQANPSAGTARRFVYKRIPIKVNEYRRLIANPSFVLEKNLGKVHGIYVTSDQEDKVFDATCRVEINGEEIFPQDFEAQNLFAYASVPVNDRIFDLGAFPAGNGVVKITVYDESAPAGPIPNPYTLNFYLKCEQNAT